MQNKIDGVWSWIYQLVCSLNIVGHDLFPYGSWSVAREPASNVLVAIKHELNESGFLFRFIIGFSMNLTYDSWQQVNTNSIYLFRMFRFCFFLRSFHFFSFSKQFLLLLFLNTFSSIYIYLFIQLIRIHYVIFFIFFSTKNHVLVRMLVNCELWIYSMVMV